MDDGRGSPKHPCYTQDLISDTCPLPPSRRKEGEPKIEGDYADFTAGVTPEQLAAVRDTAALEALLNEKELRKLCQMREKMADEPVTAADTATLIRYLRARNFKTSK